MYFLLFSGTVYRILQWFVPCKFSCKIIWAWYSYLITKCNEMFHNLFNNYRIFQNFLIEVNYIFLLACFSTFKFVDIKLLRVFSIIFLIWSICNYVPLFILNVYVCLFFFLTSLARHLSVFSSLLKESTSRFVDF